MAFIQLKPARTVFKKVDGLENEKQRSGFFQLQSHHFCFRNTINDILEGDDVCSWTKASEDLKEKMSRMAAASAWGRGSCLYLC